MKRQIKFRVWSQNCKKFIENFEVDAWCESGIWLNHVFQEKDFVFQQFTGLTDSAGKEIFEGDFVHYKYEPGAGYWNQDTVGLITWKSTGFYFSGRGFKGWLVSLPGAFGEKPNELFEVVGNIFENPELLEEK